MSTASNRNTYVDYDFIRTRFTSVFFLGVSDYFFHAGIGESLPNDVLFHMLSMFELF